MPETAPAHATQDIHLVSAMVEGAYALGMTACEMAKASKDDHKAFMTASAEFRQCFFAVRMGIRLKMSLRAGVKPKAEAEAVERDPVERDRPETERPETERPERERDRERDREPVSLPAFLKSLGVVVRNAERRGDKLPAHAVPALTRLRGLLAEANTTPVELPRAAAQASATAVLERPRSPPTTKSRLLGSAAPPRGPPPRRSSA